MYASEICAEEICVSFPTKTIEKWVKNSHFFQIDSILVCVFQKWELRFQKKII